MTSPTQEVDVKLAVGSNFVRFPMAKPLNSAHNFKELWIKLERLKISLPVYFLDLEGDWCAIHGNEELMHALKHLGTDSIKLYPTPPTRRESSCI